MCQALPAPHIAAVGAPAACLGRWRGEGGGAAAGAARRQQAAVGAGGWGCHQRSHGAAQLGLQCGWRRADPAAKAMTLGAAARHPGAAGPDSGFTRCVRGRWGGCWGVRVCGVGRAGDLRAWWGGHAPKSHGGWSLCGGGRKWRGQGAAWWPHGAWGGRLRPANPRLGGWAGRGPCTSSTCAAGTSFRGSWSFTARQGCSSVGGEKGGRGRLGAAAAGGGAQRDRRPPPRMHDARLISLASRPP